MTKKVCSRRGQISLYVLVGVLLIAALFVYVRMRNVKTEIQTPSDIDTTALEEFVNTCIQTTLVQGIDLLGKQGGYIVPPEPTIRFLSTQVPYFIGQERPIMPTPTLFAQQLGSYVAQKLPECTQHFSLFPKLSVSEGVPKAEIQLTPGEMQANVDYALVVQRRSSQKELRQWKQNIPSHMLSLLTITGRIVEAQRANGSTLCLSCFADLAEQNNATVSLITKQNGTIIFILSDDAYDEHFEFAGRFDEKEAPQAQASQEQFSITPVSPQTAPVGKEFALQITANKAALYKDYTPLFDINALTGSITFTPTVDDAGEHDIWIEATTEQGETDFITFPLKVIR